MLTGGPKWEEYIKKGYEDSKIKDAMLFSLEGKARRNFRHCDKHGDPRRNSETNGYVLQCLRRLPRSQCMTLRAQARHF